MHNSYKKDMSSIIQLFIIFCIVCGSCRVVIGIIEGNIIQSIFDAVAIILYLLICFTILMFVFFIPRIIDTHKKIDEKKKEIKEYNYRKIGTRKEIERMYNRINDDEFIYKNAVLFYLNGIKYTICPNDKEEIINIKSDYNRSIDSIINDIDNNYGSILKRYDESRKTKE